MTSLILMLSLIGQTAVMWTDLGTCEGTVVAPGQALMAGTCTLRPGQPIYFASPDGEDTSEEAAVLVSARTLKSGRVVVTFKDGGAL